MEAITIHPENAEQLEAIKSILKVLKAPFEQQSKSLPAHLLESIERGLKQANEDNTIGLDVFKNKHFSKH